MGQKAKYSSQGKAGGKGREREGGKEGKRKMQKERRAPRSSKGQSTAESKQGVPWLFHLLPPGLCPRAVSLRVHLAESRAYPATLLLMAGLGGRVAFW